MTTQRAPAKIIPRAFPGITPNEVQELIENSRIRNYPAGTTLCHENAVEQTFYMILEGDFEVSKVINNSERRLLKSLTAGDFFGEMALIHNAPRAATVVCKTDVVVLELDKDGFDRVLKHSPSVSMAMVSEISNRLRQNDELAIEDLRLRAAELAQAYQKLAEQEMARREFLGNVAHELRTPLMAASGYLSMLQKGAVSGDQLNATVDTVARNVSQIVSLVNDILFLQEIELVLPEFQAVDMAEVAHAVAKKYTKKAEARRVRVKVHVAWNLPNVFGDARALERAVSALVDNAIKFSSPGADVDIRLNHHKDRVEIAVEDHGIGIDPGVRPRIFDRFYHLEKQGDELYSGLGLGLAITRQVIQQHKGSLDVESRPGHGSTFTISLQKFGK
jgi:signal transduction histidine kinase